MLHGFPGDHRYMVHHFEPILAPRAGWRRIYPDLPGMGRSPAPDWLASQDDMLAVALDLADAVAPEEPLALVGVSWGAYLALGMVHERPDRFAGAMLTVPMVVTDPDLPEHRVLFRDPSVLARLAPDEQLWPQVAVVQSMDTLTAFREALKPGWRTIDHALRERIRGRFAFSFDPTDLPQPFEGPSLIVCGRYDVYTGFRDAWRLVDRMPRATYAVLDRAGHGLPAEQTPLFRHLTTEWLDRVEESLAERRAG
jgi:pimeloyl-ACP methyl ester carboxylesterase